MSIGCVLVPRLELIAALGGRREMLTEPIALAPAAGAEQRIGQASGAAEAYGVSEGMALSEALSRCPALGLIAPDPGAAERRWEQTLQRLEGVGAEVESERSGEAFCELDPLTSLWGPGPEQVLAKLDSAAGGGAKLGGGPTRFCAFAAASRARARRKPPLVPVGRMREFLSPLPVSLLRARLGGPGRESLRLIETLERLGVRTLGELAGLPRVAVADRFGELGLAALALAEGHDSPLRPRLPHEEILQEIGLPESAYGTQLRRALELLVERLLADSRLRGRTLRSVRLEARLAGGGSWRETTPLRTPSRSAERLMLVLGPKLDRLPAPASALGVRALELGPEAGVQDTLSSEDGGRRRELVAEAVRQARAGAGPDAVLRVVEVDPGSRVPERWAMLTPHGGGGGP